mmetsp:Transcript_20829/g.45148  ORF Transcript_20829/g.45148 Transcript_20829/m.45148 type:complete len:229 (-) Transcript_20829:28-714(-)
MSMMATMDVTQLDASHHASLTAAFTTTTSMIVVSELGDKTFFIAALLAMRQDKRAVFVGAAGALVAMTILSAAMGLVLPTLLPKECTHWAAVILFVYFGGKLLLEAVKMFQEGEGDGPSSELNDVEAELKEGASKKTSFYAVMVQAFTLTFVAEWGDRSQISTVALAAAKDPLGVVLGGSFGHCCCTSLAVLGGGALASSISERSVVAAGGVLFLIFALHGLIVGPNE